mmetsp:Transcript_17588/g.37899  ORF Transcript_17588/g.37899 Transcript_17588/m.37899 type:complete len:340 (+) Transcript_17588:773-1792(+)
MKCQNFTPRALATAIHGQGGRCTRLQLKSGKVLRIVPFCFWLLEVLGRSPALLARPPCFFETRWAAHALALILALVLVVPHAQAAVLGIRMLLLLLLAPARIRFEEALGLVDRKLLHGKVCARTEAVGAPSLPIVGRRLCSLGWLILNCSLGLFILNRSLGLFILNCSFGLLILSCIIGLLILSFSSRRGHKAWWAPVRDLKDLFDTFFTLRVERRQSREHFALVHCLDDDGGAVHVELRDLERIETFELLHVLLLDQGDDQGAHGQCDLLNLVEERVCKRLQDVESDVLLQLPCHVTRDGKCVIHHTSDPHLVGHAGFRDTKQALRKDLLHDLVLLVW